MSSKRRRIGFISFRFAGTDGVSLETAKWAEVLEGMGHRCYYFAGESDRPVAHTRRDPAAHFTHPEMLAGHRLLFSGTTRTADSTAWIHRWRAHFRESVRRFIDDFQLDLLIPQNLFAIPLNIPLALATAELVAESGIDVIAHHHDFAWERQRFLINGVGDYLAAAFPPDLPAIQHVVINSLAQRQLALRRGIAATLIPNVMDFETPPPGVDAYSADLRRELGIGEEELFVLQPTRIVQRKGIELALELLHRLNRPAQLVITHDSGDEGPEYLARLREFAALLGVRLNVCGHRFGPTRGTLANGRKRYALWDAYPHADLVTYPSLLEGFGNAFLEALYFRRPVVVNNYTVYHTDIAPKGFETILFDQYLTADTVEATAALLDDPARVAAMTERNFQLGLAHFSYRVLRRELAGMLERRA
jgi:glycosyltransferase involved in cell wall biosynthesis